jgi:hypothetical protein
LRGAAKVAEHLTEVQRQRTAFALDPLDLVLQHRVRLLLLLQAFPKLAFPRLRSVLRGIRARIERRKLPLGRFRSTTRLSKLLRKLLGASIRSFAVSLLPRPLSLRLGEGLCERINVCRQERQFASKVWLAHEPPRFGLLRESPATPALRSSRRFGRWADPLPDQ